MKQLAMAGTAAAGVAAIVLVLASPLSDSMEHWPQVQPIKEHYNVTDEGNAGFNLLLLGKGDNHRPLYALKCHSGLYEADKDFNYSGLLDCRLVSLYSKEAVSSLLTDTAKQTSDWHDRGRFLSAHLRQGCATYPDWGGRRSFRLRGMDIVIDVSNVSRDISPGKENSIRSYTVDVTVKNDSAAVTSLSAKPSMPEPAWFYHPKDPCHG